MDRRGFLTAAGASAFIAMMGRLAQASEGVDPNAPSTPFSWDVLNAEAKTLAGKPFDAEHYKGPPAVANLDYDLYRQIRFDPKKAVWAEDPLNFRLQLFHGGYIYKDPVELYITEDGQARRIPYHRDFYTFGLAEKPLEISDKEGFYSGFRVHSPIYKPDDFSEFVVFQGASYFRSKAKGQTYGLSARGIAIDTGLDGKVEEFPAFRAFWIEKPKPGETSITCYGLLDGPSISGAYKFVCALGDNSVIDIECQLYPRAPITHAGIAPFSSMFFYGPASSRHPDDFRPRVHDSDGLSIHTGNGDWIWRPLVTADFILYSVFFDDDPKGFGLIQRLRGFEHYEDIGAGYQNRPSTWVEPLSGWGEGSVDLIELPTGSEYVDNIVTFWRPKEPLQPGQTYNFRYRLTWLWQAPVPETLAQVKKTGAGLGLAPGSRFLLIDFAGGDVFAEADEEYWDFDVHASAGFIKAFSVTPHPFIDGKRIGIEYHPDGDKVADLSFQIRKMGAPISEKWVYRWAPA
jgi:periplasmic glucans biosynthesis protein